MSNPFAPKATAPTAPAGGNPFGAAPTPAPGGSTPAPQAPPATPPAASTPAPGGPVDPFGSVPDAPTFERLSQDDAAGNGTVVAWRIESFDAQVTKPWTDEKTGKPVVLDQLTVDAYILTGPRAGTHLTNTYVSWGRVVAQFKDCAGNGQWYVVHIKKVGRAVAAVATNDESMRAKAAELIAAA